MAFDTSTRKRLATFVGEARRLLTDEFIEQLQSLYGISATGSITPIERLGHLDAEGRELAGTLRQRIAYLVSSHADARDATEAAVARLTREQAFTIINRLAAIRMAETRSLIVESVGQQYQSKGFRVFESVAGSAIGETFDRYRCYLFCLFDELAIDLGVLFDRKSPQAMLFPREPALLALLALLDAPDLQPLWAEDETIGWIYQYYNDEAERKKMREESAAPRNSRELAVRNQFFTPRYVVEFLTDNTLGRIWYEMTQGQTSLKDSCRYLVRRPSEIFLSAGESPPENAASGDTDPVADLSQEELFKQPVHIPYRPLKDPREIRLLDPACGSMHFGLYAFDLFTVIYDEAWEIAHSTDIAAKSAETFAPFVAFATSFTDKPAFLRDVPQLIVEHNLHGIDIDPRAAQIASLSLWLRAQRAWHQANVKPTDRPRITRSNIVCAEPMPGDKELLLEFVEQQFPPAEQPAFGFLLEKIFDHMTLAGEAGSLLRIEKEILAAIAEAEKIWEKEPLHEQKTLFADVVKKPDGVQTRLDLSGITNDEFWVQVEHRIYDALEAYAEQAETVGEFQRRLFANDAAQGFAFIDLSRKRYDVMVMNPPFGSSVSTTRAYFKLSYGSTDVDLYDAFIMRALELLGEAGRVGLIAQRLWLILPSFENTRRRVLNDYGLPALVDLGYDVLDGAFTRTAAWVISKRRETLVLAWDVRKEIHKGEKLCERVQDPKWIHVCTTTQLLRLPGARLLYSVPRLRDALLAWRQLQESGVTYKVGVQTSADDLLIRAYWEVDAADSGWAKRWVPHTKADESRPFFYETVSLVRYDLSGQEIIKLLGRYGRGASHYGMPGLTYGMSSNYFQPYLLAHGLIISNTRPGVYVNPPANTLSVLACLNSEYATLAIDWISGGHHRTVQVVGQLPVPRGAVDDMVLARLAEEGIRAALAMSAVCETSPTFRRPPRAGEIASLFNAITEVRRAASRRMWDLVGIEVETELKTQIEECGGADWSAEFSSLPESNETDKAIVSYMLGVAFGRWSVHRLAATGEATEEVEPLTAPQACPPAQLQNASGLPARPEDVSADYPIHGIPWDGVLVDDEHHPFDLNRRVRDVMDVVWGNDAESREQELCNSIGVSTLHDYFRTPGGFFADHLKRYTKCRRQAPVYWPLSTKSGLYTLWVYYHRLNEQTLHRCLADFVDPKIRKVETELGSLVGTASGRAAELRTLLNELRDLRDEIERVIKLPWRPNLNDGVLITASPLWKLFRLSRWSKDLKACWEKLEKGDYDWAHLAYTIWPARVEKACESDRSIAIAHGLEHLCKVEPPKPKKPRGKKAKS